MLDLSPLYEHLTHYKTAGNACGPTVPRNALTQRTLVCALQKASCGMSVVIPMTIAVGQRKYRIRCLGPAVVSGGHASYPVMVGMNLLLETPR